MGFGASLIAKLKEPGGIKENLYFEIKDRILEESTDEIGRPIRRKVRTKVYGLDDNGDTRDLLIEILRERMERHKDKMPSPVMYDELSKMVVKRSGKVEHSENSHDDLVFSYLMALYVWYEGKNLKENFNINKKTIKTEESIDDDITNIDPESKFTEIIEELRLPPDEEAESIKQMHTQLQELKTGMGVMFSKFVESQRANEDRMLMDMLQSKAAKEAYAKYIQVPVEQVDYITKSDGKYRLPDSVFTDFNRSPEEIDREILEKNINFKNFNAEK